MRWLNNWQLVNCWMDHILSGCCGRKIVEKLETFKEYHMKYLDLVKLPTEKTKAVLNLHVVQDDPPCGKHH
jgi:hypothetical protein